MSNGDGEMPGLLSHFSGGGGDATTPPTSASLRSPPRRVFCDRKRLANHKRRKWGRARNERRQVGPTGGKETSRVTRSVHHRAVRPPGRVRRRARSSHLHSAPSGGQPRSDRSFQCLLRTLAEALDALMSGQIMTAMDIIRQRFRAVEASVLEQGGWGVARHHEVVPETRVISVTPGLRAMMAAAERQSHRLRQDLWKRSRDPHYKPMERLSELRKESGRSQSAWHRRRSAQCSGPNRVEGKGKEQRQRKRQRRQSKEDRAPRVSNGNGPRRGWLGDLIGGMSPDEGPYIGRSKSVLVGQQGWGNPWKVNDASLLPSKMLSTSMGR